MIKVKAIITVLFFASSAMLFAGGGAEDAAGDDVYRIGAAMSSFADKWQTYLQDGVRDFDAEHDDVEITMTDGKDDPALQLSQVENLLTQNMDAIIIVPIDISALGPVLDRCESAGVPLVVVNRLPAENLLQRVDVYVGSDSIDAGIMQGEWVSEALGGMGNVGIIMGPLGHEAAMMRTKGNKDIFANTDIKVVMEAEGKWDRAQGLEIAENWFQSDTKLDAIICNNDEMAIGALLAAQNVGISDEEIIIAGVDATPDALEYLGKGLDVTVFQSAHGQGYGGAEAAYMLLKGQDVDKMFWIPYELVTSDNMADYM